MKPFLSKEDAEKILKKEIGNIIKKVSEGKSLTPQERKLLNESIQEPVKSKWEEIKEAYQTGEGSCRELAERFGVSRAALEHRCKREGWRQEMAEISQNVAQKVVETLAERGVKHAERMLKRYDNWLCEIDKQMPHAIKKIKDASLRDVVTSQIQIDQAARRAYGMDQRELEAQGAVIPLGGMELQAKMLEQIYAIKALVKEGKIKTVDIDVEAVSKMKIIRGS